MTDYFVPRWTPPALSSPHPQEHRCGETVCAVCRITPEDHDTASHAPVWVDSESGVSVGDLL